MNDAITGLIAAHPKTSVFIALGVGFGIVPLLKIIGHVF